MDIHYNSYFGGYSIDDNRQSPTSNMQAPMRRINIILLISMLVATNMMCSQTINSKTPFSNNAKSDLTFLLPDGNYQADILDSVIYSPREMELMTKFQAGLKNIMQNDYEWYMQFVKSIPEGKPMPYDKKFGLTEKEYLELHDYMEKGVELVSSGKSKIQVMRNNEVISFKGEGKLMLFDYIKIDLNKNIILFGDEILNYKTMDKITSTKNAFKSAWQGYAWELQEPKDMNMDSIKDLKNISAKHYLIEVGRVEKSSKTFIRVNIQVIQEGQNLGTRDFSILF